MATLHPLFSGSSGNAVLVKGKTGSILVDAGVSGKRICEALAAHKQTGNTLDAILVTHEHIDHIRAAGTLARKFRLPLYASHGTWEAMAPLIGDVSLSLQRAFTPGETFLVGDMAVTAFSVAHDAAEPVGYSFLQGDTKVTIATDIGTMNEKLFLQMCGSREILLESNYDIVMLQKGTYPYALKQRILGEKGHLSNKEAACVCARLASLGTKSIILGHLSLENNTPELAYAAAKLHIESCGLQVGRDIFLAVAPRA